MEKQNKIIIGIVLIVSFFVGYYIFSDKGIDEDSNYLALEQEKTDEELIKDKFINQYDAIINWEEDIEYTIQLQELLINSKTPVIFTGFVDDVFIKDDKHLVVFWDLFNDFRFTLECSENQISEILNNPDSIFDYYVVVAKINDVNKIRLKIDGYASGEDVELGYSYSNTFLFDGNCLDFFRIID
ncbi:MAG: hypothetical protein PHY39_06480 [Endomicrobiaceae bacterium]|nr:hypothetical protein [Endomicrobiaceae bacterium]